MVCFGGLAFVHVCFSAFVNPLLFSLTVLVAQAQLRNHGMDYQKAIDNINCSIVPFVPTKLAFVVQHANLHHPHSAVLILTESLAEMTCLCTQFSNSGRSNYSLSGEMPVNSRPAYIRSFFEEAQNSRRHGGMMPVLIGQLDCLGTGVNGLQVGSGCKYSKGEQCLMTLHMGSVS